jgi:hypothetical protein
MTSLSCWTTAQQDYCYWYCILLIPLAFQSAYTSIYVRIQYPMFSLYFNNEPEPRDFSDSVQSATIQCWCISSIHIFLKSLLLLVSNNNPSVSAVATDSAVAYVLAAVGFPWVPAVVVASSIASVPACCCCSYWCLRHSSICCAWLKSLLLPSPLLLLLSFV